MSEVGRVVFPSPRVVEEVSALSAAEGIASNVVMAMLHRAHNNWHFKSMWSVVLKPSVSFLTIQSQVEVEMDPVCISRACSETKDTRTMELSGGVTEERAKARASKIAASPHAQFSPYNSAIIFLPPLPLLYLKSFIKFKGNEGAENAIWIIDSVVVEE